VINSEKIAKQFMMTGNKSFKMPFLQILFSLFHKFMAMLTLLISPDDEYTGDFLKE